MAAKVGFEHATLRTKSNLPLSYHAPHESFMDNGTLCIVGYILLGACVFVKVEINPTQMFA